MPKQVYKIENFHGGLNSDADPRDIDENQLSTLSGFVVDEIGKVRTMGGLADHGAPDPTDGTLRAGYGLFYFTADRKGAHINTLSGTHSMGINAINLSNSGSGYSSPPDVAIAAPNVSGGVNATATVAVEGDGTLGDVTITAAGSGYTANPTVTIGGVTSGGGSGGAASVGGVLQTNLAYLSHPKTNGRWPVDGLIGALLKNTTDGSEIVITDNTANTAIGTLAGGTDNDWDVNDAYTITEFPETGDDYLIAVDHDATCAAHVYSRLSNTWAPSVYPIDLGTTAEIEPTFYAVDGAVRISDGHFTSGTVNMWYGYIKRTLFPDLTPSYTIDQWYSREQVIDAPRASTWDEGITFAKAITDDTDTTTGGATTTNVSEGRSDIASASVVTGHTGALSNILKATVDWQYTVTTPQVVTFIIKCGTYTGSAFVTFGLDYGASGWKTAGTYTGTAVFNFAIADTGTGDDWGGGGSDTFRAEIITHSGTATRGILSMLLNEKGALVDVSGEIAHDNIHVHFDWEAQAGASGWSNSDNTGEWKVGASFVYDGVQESQITTLVNLDDDVTDTFVVPGSHGAIAAPSIRLYIADFAGLSTEYNKRITGVNLYMQDVSQNTTQPWFLQLSGNFETGKMRVEGTQKLYDAQYYDEPNEAYYYWEIGDGAIGDVDSQMLEPSLVTSYEINSGLKEEEESIISKYKTAVVVGRRVYIGGLEVEYLDDTRGTEVKGDAMIKSPVNKFDLFPLSRIIEASVADGDSIIKLEEYADRILQFKKHKMHLINVSQEVEFLEDTFMHKGVSTPAAVCKTDFGVAWVNKHGCYLYDGNRVNNLLEKGGRRLISDDDWSSFTTVRDESDDNPGGSMIGYVPKKRQLIVVKDGHENTDSGDIYLFDMITQSWAFGDSKFVGTAGSVERKTNFVNDWNGDLVHINDEANGSVFKWDDTADADKNASLITKDIDFGQPSVRKKIYKVYITFKGNATHVQVHYGKDGLRPTLTFNSITSGTDGSSTGSGTAAKCIAYDAGTTDWLKAELRPSASVNNISSFAIKVSGDGTNAIASDFEINDISIVYRLKNIK